MISRSKYRRFAIRTADLIQVAEITALNDKGKEKLLTSASELTIVQEKSLQHRSEVLDLKQINLSQREDLIAIRERALDDSAGVQRILERHVADLREANEHLVVATIKSQFLSGEVQVAKDNLIYMAHHDFLTELPNRVLLMERLAQEMELARKWDTSLAVLFLDLDRFKIINDSLGHLIGDAVLQSVANRLLGAVRATDIASRVGGDEFVVVISNITDLQVVSEIAHTICRTVAEPYCFEGITGHLGVSIGISMFPSDGNDAAQLLGNADVAMYYAKNSQKGSFRFFHADMNEKAIARQKIEEDLHLALTRHEFFLLYQPIVNLTTGAIKSLEALVRWRHPTLGQLYPEQFISVAEECGLIVPLGKWILSESCRQTKQWQQDGIYQASVSVNISALEFRNPDFVTHINAVLDQYALAASSLELEITESVLMEDAYQSQQVLQNLNDMGVALALDDFGTGYSSLSYLKKFPIDVLKIDQSFVKDIYTPAGDGGLVDAAIAMGKSLKKRVIAEGIENRVQLQFLRERKCEYGQGYLFSPPLEAIDCRAFLVAWSQGDFPGGV